MNSTTPQDLLDLKSRIDLWRSTRRFIRQPIPDDIRLAIVQAASRHSPRLVKKVLKLDPYRFKPVHLLLLKLISLKLSGSREIGMDHKRLIGGGQFTAWAFVH